MNYLYFLDMIFEKWKYQKNNTLYRSSSIEKEQWPDAFCWEWNTVS